MIVAKRQPLQSMLNNIQTKENVAKKAKVASVGYENHNVNALNKLCEEQARTAALTTKLLQSIVNQNQFLVERARMQQETSREELQVSQQVLVETKKIVEAQEQSKSGSIESEIVKGIAEKVRLLPLTISSLNCFTVFLL